MKCTTVTRTATWSKFWYLVVACVLFTIVCLCILALLSYPKLNEFLWSKDFLSGNCSVVSVDRTGHLACENYDGTSFDESKFPCVVLNIRLKESDGQIHTGILYQDRTPLERFPQCSVYQCYREHAANDHAVEEFLEEWPLGYVSSCIYDSTNPLQFFPSRRSRRQDIVHLFVWPCAVVLASLVVWFIYFLRSCRRGNTPCSPPDYSAAKVVSQGEPKVSPYSRPDYSAEKVVSQGQPILTPGL